MKKVDKGAAFELRFYEGYKSREIPRAVIIGTHEFPITKVFWRKRVQDKETGQTVDIFKCRMTDHLVKITVHPSGAFEIAYL